MVRGLCFALEEEGRRGRERERRSQMGKVETKESSTGAVEKRGSVMTMGDWSYPRAAAVDSITRLVCIHAGGKEDGTRGWTHL